MVSTRHVTDGGRALSANGTCLHFHHEELDQLGEGSITDHVS
jgi:hypothetical protein